MDNATVIFPCKFLTGSPEKVLASHSERLKAALNQSITSFGEKKKKKKNPNLYLDATNKNKKTQFHAFCLGSPAIAMFPLHNVIDELEAQHQSITM